MERTEEVIYLDTHIVVWLFAGEISMLSYEAAEAIENNALLISPAVVLELEYLHEIKRLKPRAVQVCASLEREIGLQICETPFPRIIGAAIKEKWVRDPFDRIITAQARLNKAILVTKDKKIHKNYSAALW